MQITGQEGMFIVKMKRKRKRRCEPNLTYHISTRCIEKKFLFKSKKVKKLIIKVIIMAQKKYEFDLINYVIMDNHFHLFIRTLNEDHTISRIMQFIKSQIATRYNKMNDRIGPLWNERFSDTIIEEYPHEELLYYYINRYIMMNPVKANIIEKPGDYVFGAFHYYLNKRKKPPILIRDYDFNKSKNISYFQVIQENFAI